jgi:hypothetical protein
VTVSGTSGSGGLVAILVPLIDGQDQGWLACVDPSVAGRRRGAAHCRTGSGLFIAPNTQFIIATVDRQEAGAASGVIATMQRIGAAIGIAIIGSGLQHPCFPGSTTPDCRGPRRRVHPQRHVCPRGQRIVRGGFLPARVHPAETR